jgi:hypothetical protein
MEASGNNLRRILNKKNIAQITSLDVGPSVINIQEVSSQIQGSRIVRAYAAIKRGSILAAQSLIFLMTSLHDLY